MTALCWHGSIAWLILLISGRRVVMREILYMAWLYLAYNRAKSIILILSVTLIIFLPVGLHILVDQSALSLSARAHATPLLVGAKGSKLELVLNSLYFESDMPPAVTLAEVTRVTDYGLALAIPLHTRFKANGFPVVGTTLDYFEFRNLKLAQGRRMGVLGECVLGAQVAARLDIELGGFVVSAPESVFDIAGVYPLKMEVTGILEPAGTAEDRAIIVDIKTAWVIAGLAHGHQDMSAPAAAAGVLRREGNTVVANASVMQYNQITKDNIDSFHFHGDTSGFPVTAVIAVPCSEKSGTLLQGKYLGDDESMQIVEPPKVMADLLDTILTVQRYVIAAIVIISLSTLMTAVLVFMLSLRLRVREIETMHRIGASKARVIGLLGAEIAAVLFLGGACAAILILVASRFATVLIRLFIL
jgi:putative ABC transport system permease protein